jgi:hypothetical protein
MLVGSRVRPCPRGLQVTAAAGARAAAPRRLIVACSSLRPPPCARAPGVLSVRRAARCLPLMGAAPVHPLGPPGPGKATMFSFANRHPPPPGSRGSQSIRQAGWGCRHVPTWFRTPALPSPARKPRTMAVARGWRHQAAAAAAAPLQTDPPTSLRRLISYTVREGGLMGRAGGCKLARGGRRPLPRNARSCELRGMCVAS